MKLSIITVNYNNAVGLAKTIKSVACQSFSNYEHIVIDGASTDGSIDIIKQYKTKLSYWLSEPDSGIYNAMNKGIRQAKGEYLLFINSGDEIYNENILKDVFDLKPLTDLVYGDLHRIFPDGHMDIVPMPNHISISHMLNATLCHPVTFIRRSLFQKYGFYREDLQIVSDWAFFLKVIAFGNVSQQHINLTISSFSMDGISSKAENKSKIIDESQKVIKESFSPELLEICTDYSKYAKFYYKKRFVAFRKIKSVFTKTGWKDLIYSKRCHTFIRIINKKVRRQIVDPLSIPIIIISYNRLADLRKLVSFLQERKHKNIVIVDNQSTYPPLLDYYKEIADEVIIKRMDRNYGHLVFWKNNELFNEYGDGYYIVTDSDIIPNNDLPEDYIEQLRRILDSHKKKSKVGFALRIDDLPDYYLQKESVIGWEKQFWKKPLAENLYDASLDTTFAIYPPFFNNPNKFYRAIRVSGNFTARHGGWYINNKELSKEDVFYFNTVNESSSWRLNEKGEFTGDEAYTP